MLSFNLKEVEGLINDAVLECYSQSSEFLNETIFKYELFHQLAKRKINGVGLAEKLDGSSTCILHAEAKAYNGQTGYLNSLGIKTKAQADLLFCNPYENNSDCAEFGRYNYKPEIIIELKQKYSAPEIRKIIQSYGPYLKHFNFKGSFYIIYANNCKVDQEYIRKIEKEFQFPVKIKILCRNIFSGIVQALLTHQFQSPVEDNDVFNCIEKALKLYGESSNKTDKAFYWRNCQQQGELDKDYTFPCEGDFNAQLYHILKARFNNNIQIHAEVTPGEGSRKRIDLSIETVNKIFFVEVKMNWDQFRKGCEPPVNIVEKFQLLNKNVYAKPHQNIVLMIQGDPHKRHNMVRALETFNKQGFSLIRYSESRRKMEVYEPVNSLQSIFESAK